jgi:hypothetical protein|tara:strand:+ start:1425 stop:1607 length:183 start_codon:yes stop_codon:yes gene_type:complete
MTDHNLKDYSIGDVVRLEYLDNPYGIIGSINQSNGRILVRFADGPKVYKFTSLEVILKND